MFINLKLSIFAEYLTKKTFPIGKAKNTNDENKVRFTSTNYLTTNL